MRRTCAIIALLVAAGAGLGLFSSGMDWLEHARAGFVWSHEARLRGTSFLLVFVVALLVRHLLMRRAHAPQAVPPAALPAPSRNDGVFEARHTPGTLLWRGGVCAMLALAGCVALDSNKRATAATAFVLLPVLLVTGWHLLRDLGAVLRMDAHGIQYPAYRPIPWSEVIGMFLQPHATGHTMLLGVRDAQPFLHEDTRKKKPRRLQLREHRGVTALPIPLPGASGRASFIYDTAMMLRQRDPVPLLPDWHPDLGDGMSEYMLEIQALHDEATRLESLSPSPAILDRLGELQAQLDAALQRQREQLHARAEARTRPRRNAIARIASLALAVLVALALWELRQ